MQFVFVNRLILTFIMAASGSGSGEGDKIGRKLFYGSSKISKRRRDDDDNGGQISESEMVDDPDFVVSGSSGSSSDGEINEPGPSGVARDDDGDTGDDFDSDDRSSGDGDGGDEEATRGRRRIRGRGRLAEKRGRSRVRGEWAKEKARRLRNEGKEYVSRMTGRVVPARTPGSPCRDGCFTRLDENKRKELFDCFWELKDYEKQNAYIAQRVLPVPVKRRYVRAAQRQRPPRVAYNYHVMYMGEKVAVCQKAFLSIHGIKKKRVQWLQMKIKGSSTGTPPGDKRGKHPCATKISGRKLECVHEHIRSLPTTTSHYTRSKSPHRKYLEAGGTIMGLYEKYCTWLSEMNPDVEAVTSRFYSKVFTTEYNIGFKPPKKDTCGTCDKMKANIEEKKTKNEDTTRDENLLEEHVAKGNFVQDLLASKKGEQDEERGMTVRNVVMDLQQTLPCPRMSTGIAYYLRKLWVYNFCIFDLQINQGSMFVWDEVTGGRGSDEIASCIMKWLNLREEEGINFEMLRIFCDNCAGQNKNLFILLAALRIIHQRKLFRIEIVFMISGHSFLPCDAKFGIIEKKLRMSDSIQTTKHYVNAIKTAQSPAFEVTEMKRDDFFDVKSLLMYVTKRVTQGFSQACQLVVSSNYNEGYFIKSDYSSEDTPENTTRCRLMKGRGRYSRKSFDLSAVPLPNKYPEERVLNPQKVKDLHTLSHYLWPLSKAWLQNLVQRQRELAATHEVTAPDDEDVGSDSENDLQDYDDPMPEYQE